MTICPHCHGPLEVLVIPGTEPLPGWRNLAQSGDAIDGANGANPDANGTAGTIAHGSGSKPSTKKSRVYNQGYDQGFLDFWELYPLKRDKRKALKAWRNAITRANANAIANGAKRYRDDPNRMAQYTKYAEGWLNADGWEDEPLPPRLDRHGKEPSVDYRPVDYDAFIEKGPS